jgi:CubicO group peptidase (beta-lactamase class C family)
MMRKLLLAIFLVVTTPAFAQECGTPAAIDDGWQRAAPADVGLDGAKLCELDKLLARFKERNIHAVVVARRGKLVMERYFAGMDERWGRTLGVVDYTPDKVHDLRSISKSVTSMLVGIALGEGKFPALDTPVFDEFPQYAEARTPEKAAVTFRHALTMSSGFAWDESIPYSNPANSERQLIVSADPVRYLLDQPLVTKPGDVYTYNGGNTALLGATITKRTGQRIDDYARDKLFAPLGVVDPVWVRMPINDITAAASGLAVRPRDAAKFGEIMLRDGAWNGKQVLPKGWAAESIKPRLNGAGIYYYGYQWWLGRSLHEGREQLWFAGFGWGGQRLFVVPGLDLVVMINAGHYGGPLQTIIPGAIFSEIVLPAVKP